MQTIGTLIDQRQGTHDVRSETRQIKILTKNILMFYSICTNSAGQARIFDSVESVFTVS